MAFAYTLLELILRRLALLEDGADVASLVLLLQAVLLGSPVELLRGLIKQVYAVSGVPVLIGAGRCSTL